MVGNFLSSLKCFTKEEYYTKHSLRSKEGCVWEVGRDAWEISKLSVNE